MSNTPKELRYAETHEWARLDDDGLIAVGISDHAQDALGDIVFVELPEIGSAYIAGDQTGAVESVKAASEIYSPVDGEVVEINPALEDAPETVNSSPYEDGWFFKLKPESTDLEHLQDAESYQRPCEDE